MEGSRWSFGGNGHIVGSTDAHRKEGRGRGQHSQGLSGDRTSILENRFCFKIGHGFEFGFKCSAIWLRPVFWSKDMWRCPIRRSKKNHENFANLLWEAFREKKRPSHRPPDSKKGSWEQSTTHTPQNGWKIFPIIWLRVLRVGLWQRCWLSLEGRRGVQFE